MPYPFPGDISTQAFLAEYWQKRPLLIRNAFPDFRLPLSANELAGLACEEEVNARIVFERHARGDWHVEHGPFDEQDFEALPEARWTLLVTDVDKWVPQTQELMEHFRFIPDWRVDDLMVSYAADGGSVGPHTDAYDVFLLQAEGRRRWQISTDFDDTCLDGLELRILQHFQPQQEWLLEPGDMLYLPPDVAHHGIAEGECMTCSIGFRAPSARQLVSEYAESLALGIDRELRYTDSDPEYPQHPGEISPQAVDKVRRMLRQHLVTDRKNIARWFGRFATEPRGALHTQPPQHDFDSLDAIRAWAGNHRKLQPSPTSRLAYIRGENESAILFADGESHDCSEAFAIALTSGKRIDTDALLASLHGTADEGLLINLCNCGIIRSFEDD